MWTGQLSGRENLYRVKKQGISTLKHLSINTTEWWLMESIMARVIFSTKLLSTKAIFVRESRKEADGRNLATKVSTKDSISMENLMGMAKSRLTNIFIKDSSRQANLMGMVSKEQSNMNT